MLSDKAHREIDAVLAACMPDDWLTYKPTPPEVAPPPCPHPIHALYGDFERQAVVCAV